MSVTELAADTGSFPDVAPGIEEWRRARGGVYTISVEQIINSLDEVTRDAGDASREDNQRRNRLASP